MVTVKCLSGTAQDTAGFQDLDLFQKAIKMVLRHV